MKQSNPGPGSDYQIKVQGKLDEKWSDWFGAMTVTVQSEGSDAPITTLIGTVADQSALRGILTKIWDLNLTLISVTRIEIDCKDRPGQKEKDK